MATEKTVSSIFFGIITIVVKVVKCFLVEAERKCHMPFTVGSTF